MSLGHRLARVVLNGFESMFADFQNITLGAQARFESADWQAVHAAMRERLTLYKKKVRWLESVAKTVVGEQLRNRQVWSEAKLEYAALVDGHPNREVAETFFNSIYGYQFQHAQIRNTHAFVFEEGDEDGRVQVVANTYRVAANYGAQTLAEQLLEKYVFNIPYEDKARDAARVAQIFAAEFDPFSGAEVETLESIFYRNKAAYLVGRVVEDQGSTPFVLVFLNNERGGIYVDALLFDPEAISIVFSFASSYFMVDTPAPSQTVNFLKQIMPHKEVFELYTALGFTKHGKTEFYRMAVSDTWRERGEYLLAPGIKGMVMLVFTLPGFNYVYKVIKDRFTPPKSMTREQVKEKYLLVRHSDRAGRMADTQEFSNLAFDRRRFSEELLQELRQEIPSLLEERGNVLLIKHVYVERKMVPLNLYLKDATEEQLESVMDEYGSAIKQLAAANIFPGDMLLKNFGVTRHGRVVFYDYDEITPLLDCHFRTIPEPENEMQEMASQPWYDVGPNDVFPEEFRHFFAGNRRAKAVFEKLHADLYDPEYWSALQENIRAGEVSDVFPYRRRERFDRAGATRRSK